MGPTPPFQLLVARHCGHTCQRHRPRLGPAHALMFLPSGHAEIVGFLPAITRVPKAQLLAEGITRDIIPVAFEIADQRLDGLPGLDLRGVEVPQVGYGCVYPAAPKQGKEAGQHRIADLGPATEGTEFLGTFLLR